MQSFFYLLFLYVSLAIGPLVLSLSSHSYGKTLMPIQTIESTQELQQHIMALIAIEPKFATVYEQVGIPSLRHNAGGFEQLMRAMVGQQLSVAAAASIWQKLLNAGLTTPHAIHAATDEALKAQGLSKQKTRYVRSLVEHDIDFTTLELMPDEAVIKTLTAVTGIGRWTAEMYLLFSLKRAAMRRPMLSKVFELLRCWSFRQV